MKSKLRTWLLPAAVVLFILEVLTLPLALGIAYAFGSRTPEHTLTFSGKALTWDGATEVAENGAARLSLFESLYQNAQAEDGARILAPGTRGDTLVRLKNDSDQRIRCTAVIYSIRSSERLPVGVGAEADGFSETCGYQLPAGIPRDAVIRAVSGSVEPGGLQDFSIDWYWLYEDSRQQDLLDTLLGDQAAAGGPEDVTVGIYITAEDLSGTPIVPKPPKTGYDTLAAGYGVLLGISALAVAVLTWMRKREMKQHEG